jgi:hypothetical protein
MEGHFSYHRCLAELLDVALLVLVVPAHVPTAQGYCPILVSQSWRERLCLTVDRNSAHHC